MKSAQSRIGAAFLGAVVGAVVALLFELLGHPSWYILAMVTTAVLPSVVFAFADRPQIDAFRSRCKRWPIWSRYGLILLFIAITLTAKRVLEPDPLPYNYLPLLVPVIASAILFGIRAAVLTVVLTTLAADLFFVVPRSTFALTNVEDVVGLLVFATLGALSALAFDGFLNLETS